MNLELYRSSILKSQQDNIWTLGNDTLYDLCKSNMLHTQDDVIIAKVWLIGRSYAAAIERTRSKTEINDDFYKKVVAPKLKNEDLDNKIQSLKNEKDINEENIIKILELHGLLTKLFKEISGLEKRSLSSKYLHFHLPELFYIYDSRVVSAMRKFVSRCDENYKNYISNEHIDKEYAKFFINAYTLKNLISTEFNIELTPREVDNFLIDVANISIK